MDVNSERKGLEQKFFVACEPVVQETGYRLYDIEYLTGQKLLRLFIENPQTKTALIEDCVKVDHALNSVFETYDWIPEEIVLEVSSPGVYRHLNRLEHFKMFDGAKVTAVIMGKLTEEQVNALPKKIKGDRKFRGVLQNVTENDFVLNIEGANLKLDYKQVKEAHLDPDLDMNRK